MNDHKEFYIGSSMENDAALAECQIYLNVERLLRSNLETFKCKVPPIVLELTFYNLWSWDVPEKIRAMMPDLKRAVLPRKSKDWNCVWLSKMTLPDCERIYCELIFFGNSKTEPGSPDFRKIMLDLMHEHEELTGYNIIGISFEMAIPAWVNRLGRISSRFTIQDCGEINPRR